MMLSVGCATTSRSVEKSVTDFEQVAGSWSGWAPGSSGGLFRGNFLIRPNGRYRLVWEGAYFTEGNLTLENGIVRFGNRSTTWTGKLTLVEVRGAEHLRFVLDSGALWMELERVP
jgi:hypothetical protein